MKVLVTGHQGYIGSVMVPMLLAAGHEVSGYDSDLHSGCTFEAGGRQVQVPSLRKDIRDVHPRDLEGFDAVIHLAALSNDPLGNLDTEITYELNHRASVRMAKAAKDAGVKRFLFASSSGNYGHAGGDLVDETRELNPVSAYGWSKVMAERDMSEFADTNFSPTFLRAGIAYGLSPRFRFDLLLNDLVASAVTERSILLSADGGTWLSIVHVEDIALAFVAALGAAREKVHNEAFNVGSTHDNYRLQDVAAMVAGIVPGCRLELARNAAPVRPSYRVNCGKIARVLPAFRPRWTARLGAEQLFQAYRDAALSLAELESSKFNRMGHIHHLIAQKRLGSDLRFRRIVEETPSLVPLAS